MDLKLSEPVVDGGYAVVALHGELDISTAEQLRNRLLAILAGKAPSLVLDMSELAFMDSTGVSVLVAIERRAHELGGTLSLVALQKVVARVLHVTSLDRHFPIFPTVDDALHADREAEPPVAAT